MPASLGAAFPPVVTSFRKPSTWLLPSGLIVASVSFPRQVPRLRAPSLLQTPQSGSTAFKQFGPSRRKRYCCLLRSGGQSEAGQKEPSSLNKSGSERLNQVGVRTT